MKNEVDFICANLLKQGYIKKIDFPSLEIDENLFKNVEENLLGVGLELIVNSYSDYYAVRFKRDIQDHIEQSNNLGLRNNEVAMLVILWAKLILPKRVESNFKNSNSDKNIEISLEKSEKKEKITKENEDNSDENFSKKHFVRISELYAEFGIQFGSKTAFKSTLTRLSNLQFIRIHDEIVTENIMLDLLIDGYQLGNEIKKSALAYKLAGIEEDELDEPEYAEEDDEDFVEGFILEENQIEVQNKDNEEDDFFSNER